MNSEASTEVRHRHGTTTAYQKDVCRCNLCREANRLYMQKYRRARGVKPNPDGWGEQVRRHGTRSRYNHGCRCAECRTANAAYAAVRAHLAKASTDVGGE